MLSNGRARLPLVVVYCTLHSRSGFSACTSTIFFVWDYHILHLELQIHIVTNFDSNYIKPTVVTQKLDLLLSHVGLKTSGLYLRGIMNAWVLRFARTGLLH